MLEIAVITKTLDSIIGSNTAAIVMNKVEAAKTNREKDKTIQELEQIINELISEKSELIRISNALGDELITKKISDNEIEYLSEQLLPIVQSLLESSVYPEEKSNASDIVEILKPLLSKETFNILQTLGFNFKEALGEPLTLLVRDLISNINSGKKQNNKPKKTKWNEIFKGG